MGQGQLPSAAGACVEPLTFSNHASQVNWHTWAVNKRAEPEQTLCQNSLLSYTPSCLSRKPAKQWKTQQAAWVARKTSSLLVSNVPATLGMLWCLRPSRGWACMLWALSCRVGLCSLAANTSDSRPLDVPWFCTRTKQMQAAGPWLPTGCRKAKLATPCCPGSIVITAHTRQQMEDGSWAHASLTGRGKKYRTQKEINSRPILP